jgi:hypothetical protein
MPVARWAWVSLRRVGHGFTGILSPRHERRRFVCAPFVSRTILMTCRSSQIHMQGIVCESLTRDPHGMEVQLWAGHRMT